jgi:hypothetical protein
MVAMSLLASLVAERSIAPFLVLDPFDSGALPRD